MIVDTEKQRQEISTLFLKQKLQDASISDLKGQTLISVLRRGNWICMEFDHDLVVAKPRLGGRFSLDWQPYIRFQFLFDQPLYFVDPSGTSKISKEKSWEPAKYLGPDVWDLVCGWHPSSSSRLSMRSIRTVLLDQRVIAGIGSPLADQILWEVGISPWRRARDVFDEEWDDLVSVARYISRAREWEDIEKEDLRFCFRCAKPKQRDRGVLWCPLCQR